MCSINVPAGVAGIMGLEVLYARIGPDRVNGRNTSKRKTHTALKKPVCFQGRNLYGLPEIILLCRQGVPWKEPLWRNDIR